MPTVLLVAPKSSRTLRLALAVLTAGVLVVLNPANAAGQINSLPSSSKVSPRPEESTLKLKQDAETGDAEAQLLLGMRYMENRRDVERVDADSAWVGPDLAEAARWFRKAAEQGHPLGIMRTRAAYYRGQGVAQDGVEVCKWGIIGAALAKNDQEREMFKTSTETMAKGLNLTPEQRAEAEKRASDWLEAFKNRKKK
jgi:TPR repeat protein